jgi:hypothetical protein
MFHLIAPEPSQQICATLGPFFLQTLHSLLLHQMKTYLVAIHNETRNTFATQWTSQYLFLHKSNHLETLPHGKFEGHFPILIQSLEDYPHHNWKQPSNL